MSTVMRMLGWAWLMAGLLAVLSMLLGGIGSGALPAGLAPALALPWSQLIPLLGMTHKMGLALMATGVFVNAQILFVIANVLEA